MADTDQSPMSHADPMAFEIGTHAAKLAIEALPDRNAIMVASIACGFLSAILSAVATNVSPKAAHILAEGLIESLSRPVIAPGYKNN